MKHLLLFLLAAVALSSCTSFNLIEQVNPPDRRVPVVLPIPDNEMVKGKYVLYELNGSYYTKLTVAMAQEDVPLLTERIPDKGMSCYVSEVRYTPIPGTEQVFFFKLNKWELQEARITPAKHPKKTMPEMIPEKEFNLKTARKILDPSLTPDYITKPVSTGYIRTSIRSRNPTYAITCLPIDKGTRGAGYYTKATLLALPDLAGNLLIGATEATIGTVLTIILSPVALLMTDSR